MRNRNVSIATLLSVALVAVVTLLLGALAAAIYTSERHQLLAELKSGLEVSAEQQATGLALPMWNFDDRHVRAIIGSGMSRREIFAIAAITPDKTYILARNPDWSLVWRNTEPPDSGLLVQQRPIVHGDETLGTVRVYATSRFLEQDLSERLRSIVIFIVVLDATLVASLTLLLWRMLLKPLQAVERFAASVKAGVKGGYPQDVRFIGELQTLAGSIQEMTEMLDSRYRALRESEERLKLATRAAHIGIWDWDIANNRLVWDEQMYRLYGVSKDEVGSAYEAWARALTPEDFRQAHEDVKAALRGERPFATEWTIRRGDGEERIVKGESATIVGEDGRGARIVGVNFDITERKRAEEAVRQINAELEKRVQERTAQLESAIGELARARDQAESATRAKSEFLANMSHEIRTPLNAMLGMTDLALRTELSTRQRGYLSKAKSAADSLLAIINDILDFSKIEAGKLEIEAREFLLQDVLDKVTALVGLKAQEKGLDLLLSTAPDVPPSLVGDQLRLEQVLINLCSNAVKFTTHGEIVLVSVKLGVVEDDRVSLRFSVKDTGIGMSEDQLGGLFKPFNQLDASTTRKYGGTGLGLAICKQLVNLMGGEIGVRSQLGKGSDFFFTASFGVGRLQPKPPPQPDASLRALRILVVDDSLNSREILRDLLGSLGYRPTMAASAHDALHELERCANDRPYDLVLLDWKMPEIDGFELAEQIRRSTRLLRVPKMIMVTAYGDETLLRRAVTERLAGCLAKPVNASSLLDAIMTAFGPEDVAQVSAPAAQPATAGAPPALRGRRVLLVEDNEFNRIVATELLADVAGMDVVIAVNGDEAVRRVRNERFDAVLMDVQMPVMDGYQATALLRQSPAHGSLPIIAMTAHAMARDRDKCLAVGMNDYVTKPFEPKELFSVLVKWVTPAGPGPEGGGDSRPPVLFELGLQRCMGRAELYQRIVARFLDTRFGDPASLQAALDANDLPQAAAIAHSVISTAGTLGAELLSDAARTLQLVIESGETQRLASAVQAFAQQHRSATHAMEAYLAQHRAPPVPR